jgi:tungstate transport system substrate-binding protein
MAQGGPCHLRSGAMKRRTLLFTCGLSPLLTPSWAQTVLRKSLQDPMRLGVETSLFEAGLASQLQRSLGRDTGVAVQLVPGTSAALLMALERGELDATMTNAPELETKLEKQGLAHDRQAVTVGDLVLVGPLVGKGKKATDPAGVLREPDIAVALARLSQAQARFIGAPQGSGAHLAELALWRAAKVAPAAPWYIKTDAEGDAIAQAATQEAYTLVERALWLKRSRKPLAVMVEGDPRMAVPVHVMRSFRVRHPAGKLFVQWVAGPSGRRVAASLPGWRAPAR